MKYAFMSFSCPELTFPEVLDAAVRFGYDGVEPRTDCQHRHGIEIVAGPDMRKQVKAQAQERGIAVCCLATSCRYADAATADDQIDQTRRLIDLAGDIDSPCLRVFGGPIPDGVNRDDAVSNVADALRSVAGHAADRGVFVCVETHDDWCNPKDMVDIMKRVDHPAIAINWDIMHPVRSKFATMEQAYRTMRPWVKHLHFHDGQDRDGRHQLVPIGEGDIDHRLALELLKADGYEGCLSGEWIGWEPFERHLPRELATMKEYEDSIGA